MKQATADNPFANAQFLLSCARIAQLPDDALPEVAFVGRSNAGKSSALNVLCAHRGLARVSKTPGRTQLINQFALKNGSARLVDLPGYGFAAVPGQVKQDWAKLIAQYLEVRANLCLLVLMMDVRHPLTPLDVQMLDWAKASHKPCHVLLTKADKLSRGAATASLLKLGVALKAYGPGYTAQLFSALTPLGVEGARAAVEDALAQFQPPSP